AVGTEQVVASVKRRFEKAVQAELDKFKSQEDKEAELAKSLDEEKAAKIEALRKRQAAMAASEVGQKKERIGTEKMMSSEGRKTQSHDSLMREYAIEAKKKPENQNPLVMAYAEEH